MSEKPAVQTEEQKPKTQKSKATKRPETVQATPEPQLRTSPGLKPGSYWTHP